MEIKSFILTSGIFIIAFFMGMTGRGGGNFYVMSLVFAGLTINQAATTGQLMMVATSLASASVFARNRYIDWKLALIVDPPTALMAFVGGYYANRVPQQILYWVLSFLLLAAGLCMFIPKQYKPRKKSDKLGYWHRCMQGQEYEINLWLAVPLCTLVGLVSGAVGISGGAFKLVIMVMIIGVPTKVAIGTSSVMVALSALMGFAGHAWAGDFLPRYVLPVCAAALAGGFLGSHTSLSISAEKLGYIAGLMIIGAGILMTLMSLGIV